MARSFYMDGAKYLWCRQEHDTTSLHRFAEKHNLSLPVVETLLSRGVSTDQAITDFLFTPAETLVGDPSLLKDAEKAVVRIERALQLKEKILIAGDYDVDGVTSSALLLACLAPLGACVNFFLPHRQRDGYGLSVRTIERAAANGYTVVITVDNGITAYEPARKARELGIDLIITDHHRPYPELPDAYAIVNPHQETCPYPFKHFAGVGVIFKLMSLLYMRRGQLLPLQVHELLLLGTIADVVPLLDENRYWVRHCLQRLEIGKGSMALEMLKLNARYVKPKLSSLDIGFYLAPQINALGRLDDARAAVHFLLGTDKDEIVRIGAILLEHNTMRKKIEQSVVAAIIAAIEKGDMVLDRHAVLVACDATWQAGVVGLAASRLVALYGRPAIVLHLTPEGIAKGSCRSIPEINMFELLQEMSDMLLSFGGHPMAAGVSLRADRLDEFRERLHAAVIARVDIKTLRQKIYLDGSISLQDITTRFMHDVSMLEPFGAANREPLFYLSDVSLVGAPQLLKDAHVKFKICADGVLKSVIMFNRPDVYHALCRQDTKPFDLAVSVVANQWNGVTSLELSALDIAYV